MIEPAGTGHPYTIKLVFTAFMLTSSPFHRNESCYRHDIAHKMALKSIHVEFNSNHSLLGNNPVLAPVGIYQQGWNKLY
jgi:hypothetical protein